MFKRLARWILKGEKKKKKELYFDVDNADQLSYWRAMHKWAESDANRAYVCEEINGLLDRFMEVKKDNIHEFYIIQGSLAEVMRLNNLPEMIDAKLESIMEKLKQKKPVKDDSPLSVAEHFQ